MCPNKIYRKEEINGVQFNNCTSYGKTYHCEYLESDGKQYVCKDRCEDDEYIFIDPKTKYKTCVKECDPDVYKFVYYETSTLRYCAKSNFYQDKKAPENFVDKCKEPTIYREAGVDASGKQLYQCLSQCASSEAIIVTTTPVSGKKCVSHCPADMKYQMDDKVCSATCEHPFSYRVQPDGSHERFYCS